MSLSKFDHRLLLAIILLVNLYVLILIIKVHGQVSDLHVIMKSIGEM